MAILPTIATGNHAAAPVKTTSGAETATETKPATTTGTTESTLVVGKRKAADIVSQLGLLAAIVGPLCLTFYAAISLTRGTVHWSYPLAALVTAAIANLGTTAGFHRMLTHQAFKAHPVVQYILLILGAVAGMGSPVKWAHDHIHHHSHSDTENDLHSPHTPRFHGRLFQSGLQWFDAHIGWLFRNHQIKVSARARQVTDTPAARFVDRTASLWLLAGLLVPLCFGWNAFVWVGMVRLFLNHHITWSVNSICHVWGQQPFQNTKDKSKNNVLVGILALGEGWHNNHHFRPTSARHGLLPGQIDITYGVICLLERCKLAWDVQRYALCPHCNDWYAASSGTNGSHAMCRK